MGHVEEGVIAAPKSRPLEEMGIGGAEERWPDGPSALWSCHVNCRSLFPRARAEMWPPSSTSLACNLPETGRR